MNLNDHFLQQIIQGNTLEALNVLFSSAASTGEGLLAVNRSLYGPLDDETLERIKTEEQEELIGLSGDDPEAKALALYNLGCFALRQDDILDARLRFSEAAKLQPENLMARHNLGYCYELMAEIDEAKAEYAKVLEQNPKCALTHLNLAQLKLLEGDYEGGLEELNALHADNPDNVGILLYLCRGLLLRGSTQDIEHVLELLDHLPESEKYPDLRECRTYALYLLGAVDEAEAAFNAILEENNADLFARMGLIKLLNNKGNLPLLKQHIADYLAISPDDELEAVLKDLQSDDEG